MFGCETDAVSDPLRWFSAGAVALLVRKFEKIASAAAKVGSSRFAAGVPVLDRDRLVDFPNDPVSATVLRDLVPDEVPSLLSELEKMSMSAHSGVHT